MPLENSQIYNNTPENHSKLIQVTPLDKYLELIKNSVPTTDGLSFEEKIEQAGKIDKSLEINISNELNALEVRELIESGIVDDLGTFTFEDKSLGDKFIDYLEQGYLISHINLCDEQGNTLSRQYYRVRKNLTNNEMLLKAAIEDKYKNLNLNKLELIEAEKEQKLITRVKAGEIVYLGQKTIQEFIQMRKNGLPFDGIEQVIVFDENHNYLKTLDTKVYAQLKK